MRIASVSCKRAGWMRPTARSKRHWRQLIERPETRTSWSCPRPRTPATSCTRGGRSTTRAYGRARVAFEDVARRRGAWIAVGLVRPVEDGFVNSAVLLDPDGDIAAIADKRFLWHFDSRWFREGTAGEVIALPWGSIGMFVCADARMTEIPRRLAVGGARLLLDPTALVLSPLGTNAQLEYMLAARAWENGVFLAVANKCGSEGDGLEAVYVELPLALAWQKEMAPGTHIVRNRPVGQW